MPQSCILILKGKINNDHLENKKVLAINTENLFLTGFYVRQNKLIFIFKTLKLLKYSDCNIHSQKKFHWE